MTDPPATETSREDGVRYARPVRANGLIAEVLPPMMLGRFPLSRRDAAYDLGLVLLVALVLPFGGEIGMLIVSPTLPDMSDLPGHEILPVKKAFDALLVIALAAYLVYRHRVPAGNFGLQLDRMRWQPAWSLITIFAVYAVFLIMVLVIGLVVMLFPPAQEDLKHRAEFMKFLPVHSFIGTVLLMLPVAVHEELLFRGLLIPLLKRVGCNWSAAVVLSTGVFAILHAPQGGLGVVQIFGVGLVLGVMFVVTRSLVPVIVAHFVFNVLQMELARRVTPWLEELGEFPARV